MEAEGGGKETHEVAGIDADEDLSSLGRDTNLVDRLLLSLPLDGDCAEGYVSIYTQLGELGDALPTQAKAFSTNSLTGWVSPVART